MTTARRLGAGPKRLAIAFFALERRSPGTVPVFAAREGGGPELRVGEPLEGEQPLFYALSTDAKDPPATTVPLVESIGSDGTRTYATEDSSAHPGDRRTIGRVWRNPLRVPLPHD